MFGNGAPPNTTTTIAATNTTTPPACFSLALPCLALPYTTTPPHHHATTHLHRHNPDITMHFSLFTTTSFSHQPLDATRTTHTIRPPARTLPIQPA
ncbi:hypothetical protein E2C01_044887 [Portunus trituberculatus]|uniref:Uncharacterized protein n=1 Tax=Portunus trituberculatus TaxID=210409 RepID=A0A5B7FTA9_PORTR|nr:hypothetical protein [Portunus trituberculatus]